MFYNQTMKYICQCCGAEFGFPSVCRESRGEHFGSPVEETVNCCPYCGGSYEGGIHMEKATWRRDAKNVLYSYYPNLRRIKEVRDELIQGQSPRRDQRYHGGISDPTAVKTMKLESGEAGCLQREIAAVKTALAELDMKRRDNKYKLALVEMVYFRRSHTLYGAAAYLGIPERTAHRWVNKIIVRVAQEMGFLE